MKSDFIVRSGLQVTTDATISGNVTATAFSGNGVNITSVDAATLGGNTASEILTSASGGADTAYSNAVSYTDTAISNLVDSAPGALDTLNELAAALGDDANFSTTVTNSLASKATSANPTFTGTLTIDSTIVQDYSTATTTATDQTAVDTFAAASYRSAKYFIQITTGTDYHVTEILVLHDGTSVYITEYGTMYDNTSLASFTADVSGSDVRLLATPASATSTVFKIFKTLIAV